MICDPLTHILFLIIVVTITLILLIDLLIFFFLFFFRDKLIEIMERLIEHFTSNVAEASDYAVNAANTGSAGLA